MKKFLHLNLLLVFSFLSFSLNAQLTDLAETFDSPDFPVGWDTQIEGTGIVNNWGISGTTNAGGSAYELVSYWQNVSPGKNRLISPAINTVGLDTLNLSFTHFFLAYSPGVTMRLQSSTDKVNWTNETWSFASGNINIGPESVFTTVVNNLNSATTYLAFVVEGNLYNYNNWYIDNVYTSSDLSPAIIELNSPKTGSFWAQGTEQEINWMSLNVEELVDIEYSTDGGGIWLPVANDFLSSNGSNTFFWTIPAFTTINNNCKVRVITSSQTISDASDVFTLSNEPQFTIELPTTSTVWMAGQAYNVAINNTGPYTALEGDLKLSYDGGNNFYDYVQYLYELQPGVNTFTIEFDQFSEGSTTSKLAFFPYDGKISKYFESQIFETQAAPASLTLNNPNANSFWQGGTTKNIQWNSVNIEQDINIEYSLNGGSSWVYYTSVYGSNGFYTYPFDVPVVAGNTSALIRISTVDGSFSSTSNSFIISPDPQFTFIQPDLTSELTAGQTYTVEINNNGGQINDLSLYLSLDGGLSYNYFVKSITLPNGISQHEWSINRSNSAAEARLTLYDPTIYEWITPSDIFTILPAPPITIVQPAAGPPVTEWTAGQTYQIEISNPGGNAFSNEYGVFLSTDAGINWNYYLFGIFGDIISGLSQYSWTIDPYMVTNQAMIIVYDYYSGEVVCQSPVFSILPQPPTITINYPSAGEYLRSGRQVYIEWMANTSLIVNIQYSIDGGANWLNAATEINSYEGYNSYYWIVPPVTDINPDSRIRVVSGDGTVSGVSNPVTISSLPQVSIEQPAAGWEWATGMNYYIYINNQGPYSSLSGYIILSTNGGVSHDYYLIYVHELYPGMNSFVWNTTDYPLSDNCKLAFIPDWGFDPNWQFFSESSSFKLTAFVPVSQISISGQDGVSSINVEGGTLQMYASVLPANASSHNVNWSVTDISGRATIDQSGLLTAYVNGTVQVNANATDNSGVTSSFTVIISNQTEDPEDKNIIKEGTFPYDGPIGGFWYTWSPNGGTAEVIEGVAQMVPAAIGETWELQIAQEGWTGISNGSSYTLSFLAWSETYRSMEVSLEDVANDYQRLGSSPDAESIVGRSDWWVQLTPTPTIYTFHLTVDSEQFNSYNKLTFMTSAEFGRVYIDDVSLVNDIFGPASIEIISPSAGNLWQSGTDQIIEWNSVNVFQNVALQFSLDGGTSWTNIQSIYPQNGYNSYLWNVSSVPGLADNALIRVSASDASLYSISNPFTILGSTTFAGGTGTAVDPYLISNADQLNSVRLFLGPGNSEVYFLQTADIDLSFAPWVDGEGWAPIGDGVSPFYGKYNGNGFVISGLTINRPAQTFIGLFGSAIGASLYNISLVDVVITGYFRVGALVGRIQNGYIGNCYSTGTLKGELVIAGLVGNLYNGSILENSYSSVNVQMIPGGNNQQAAGLVARILGGGSVNNCFSTGSVEGPIYWAGGLVAILSDGEINNCYSTSDVSGNNFVGGLVGIQEAGNITNSYSVGKVSSNGLSGGMVASTGSGITSNSYWNVETSGHSESSSGEPRNTSEMINTSMFSSWDFINIWSSDVGISYPYLQLQGSPSAFNYPPSIVPPSSLAAISNDGSISLAWQTPSLGTISSYSVYRDGMFFDNTASSSYVDNSVTNYITYSYYVTAIFTGGESVPSNSVSVFPMTGFASGDGTALNPFLVSNPGELFTVRLYPTSYFRQVADIDLGVSPWIDGEGWEPIGSFASTFNGFYDGDGFTISNLTINRPTEQAVGLFGSTNGSIIKNVNLTGVNVTGFQYVGSLAGDVNNSKLLNISTQGTVVGEYTVGGIAGGLYASELNRSHSSGNVQSTSTADNYCGGIAGQNWMSTINNSYSLVNVFASGFIAGGISGTNENKSTISNSYFKGSVSSPDYAGGIAGWNANSIINMCYSTGFITSPGIVGGLIGDNINGVVTNSYWNTQTSMQTDSPAGEGRTTSEMTYAYSSNTYTGWDFGYIWANDTAFVENNGYPYLKMLDISAPSVTTFTPDFITPTSAFIGANVTANGGAPVFEKGVCWSTATNPTILNSHTNYYTGGVGPYSITITGLAPQTTFYVRAYATNAVGTSYGEEYVFTTVDLDPSTMVFSLIGGNAYYETNGELPFWGPEDDYDLTYIGEFGGQSAYQISNIELLVNGEFKIRKDHQWLENYGYDGVTITGDPTNFDRESIYGNIKTLVGKLYEFTFYVDWANNSYTLSLIPLSPAIVTSNISSFTSGSAITGGEITDGGISPVVAGGVVWNTNPNPAISDFYTSDISGAGTFTSVLNGLTPYTTYYVRAFAKTDLGAYFYGNEYSFTTLNNDATISSVAYNINQSTLQISNIPATESLAVFKSKLIPAVGAIFEVYQSPDTVATLLSSSCEVLVIAQDGTIKSYNVIVNSTLHNDADFISFNLNGINANLSTADKTVTATLPFGTDVTSLKANFTISGGALIDLGGLPQVSGETANDFTGPVIYTILAENGSTFYNWVVTISLATPSSDASISSSAYSIDSVANTITNVPGLESLDTFKGNLTPAPDATFEVYKSDAVTVATDLQSGYLVIVTAQDGTTTKTYTITLNSVGSSLAAITVFQINGVSGTINSTTKNVTLTLPYGTNVTNLKASFIISNGATAKVGGISQISSTTANDFTAPVVYEITAENGTTIVNWTVTVSITTPSSIANVSSSAYTVIGATGVITNVPAGESLAVFKSKLIPASGASFEVYKSDGTTVASDLQTGYKVIVTAQDGSTTKTYFLASNQTNITAFSIAGVNGSIFSASKAVTLTLPFGNDITNLIATYTLSSNATASIAGTAQVSGVNANNFSGGLVYNITAEDGITTANWTVTVTVSPASTATGLSSLVYTVDNSAKTISNVPLNETLAALKANLIPATAATLEVYNSDGITIATDLQTGHKAIVTAQDGTTKATYGITLNTAASSLANFVTFSAAGISASVNSTAKTVTATLPVGTNLSSLAATFTASAGATVKVAGVSQESGVTANNFTSPVIYAITAENGTLVNWTVTLTAIQASTNATVSSLSYSVDNSAGTISSVPVSETLSAFKSKIIPATNATIEVYNIDGVTVATDLQAGYKLIATAEDGTTTKTYTIETSAAGFAAGNTVICSGETASLTLTGNTGTIQWQQSADGITGWVNVTGGTGGNTSNYTTAGLTSTTYFRAEVTDNTIVTYSNIVEVGIAQAVADAGVISGEIIVCKNQGAYSYTVPEIANASSYNWVLPNGATGTSTSNSINISFGLAFATGVVEVKGVNNCYNGVSSIIIVTANPSPASAGAITGTTFVCQGQDSVTYTVPVIANATSYIWTLPSGDVDTTLTNSIMVDYGTSSVSGTISVKGNNLCGNGTASSLPVTVNQLPANAGSITGPTTVCQGVNLVNYAVPSIARADSYTWTLPEGASGTSTSNIISVNFSTTAVSGNILWKGVNACGSGGEGVLPVTVTQLPASAGKINGEDTICIDQDDVVYKATSIANTTSYVWTLPTGATGTSSVDSIVVNFSSSFVSGTISVMGQNSCGVGSSAILNVSVLPEPELAGTIDGPPAVCQGETMINFTVPEITNATSYLWLLPEGVTGTSTSNSIDLDFGTDAVSGFIEVAGQNRCYTGQSSIIGVIVNKVPANAGPISGVAAICPGTSSVLYGVATIADASSYIWTLPGGVSGTSTTKQIFVNYSDTALSGAITVRGHNSCDGPVSELDVTVFRPYEDEEICLVTIDRETGKNMVVWEKTQGQRIASYNIYRQGNIVNQYDSIGNIPFDGLTVFVDETSVPEERQYKYKISAIDSCDNESSMSPWHKTMFLQYVSGSNGVMLSWQPYESEAGSMNFDSYIIMRGIDSTALDSLTTISSDLFVFTDKSAEASATRMFYRVGGVKHFPCDPAGLLVVGKKASSGPFVHSLSNLEDNRLQSTGIANQIAEALKLTIYPSPFIHETKINYKLDKTSRIKIEVFNLVGEKIKVLIDENQSSGSHKVLMNASDVNYYPGVYYLKIYVDDVVIIRKTMLAR